ncbi:efflux RND transporter permease subunit [Rapidithrix thailandica]|uniref:Efflux RND transporter permease subunit n=1 Tax=Rapidithrix thailandica TaxID=413964 RepID=A0AAW9RX13_9BACT
MANQDDKKIKREFGLSTLSVNNSTSVFILTGIIVLFGLYSYITMPKEQFPEVVMPTVYVNTIYPGNSPVDIENLITRPIEKELKSIKGVKKINSTSAQDVSVILIEFNEDIEIAKAIQDTKDAVDKSKKELPNDLDEDPQVLEVDLSELPIMMVNLSGDFELDKLKDYAEYLEDEMEALSEVSKVDIIGALDREIQVNADLYKMEAVKITFGDIEKAIANENITMSGGDILTNGYRRSLRVFGEFQNVEEIKNIVVKSEEQNTIYLKDVAEVVDSYVERESFARMATRDFATEGNFPVVTLSVVKRNGENLINATEKIDEILEEAKAHHLPSTLNIEITNSQADHMKLQLSNLENSIISGMLLVVLVLLFFLGFRNALFVGLAIPLSMFMSFMILSALGVSVNMVMLFGLILALGMLVDNAIVVIENIYRLREQGMGTLQAAKEGVGEVASAIISSTATTLAAFVPLAFWPGIMGEFMKYLPITLIIVLTSSLFVGLVINPVVAAGFMKVDNGKEQKNKKNLTVFGIGLAVLSVICFFVAETYTWGNLFMLFALISFANAFVVKKAAYWFQNTLLVRLEKIYLKTLRYALTSWRPYVFLIGTTLFLFFSLGLFSANQPQISLFSDTDPNYVYIYMEAAQGTDVKTTNELTKQVEKRVFEVLEPYSEIVESVVTNVGQNTGNPMESVGRDITPNKSKIAIAFEDFENRNGISTSEIMNKVGEAAKGVPGLKVTTDKEKMGPPVGKPVNIEVTGENYITLIEEAEKIKNIIEHGGVDGLDGLQIEVDLGKPELLVNIDRAKAGRYGLSTGMLAADLRTAIYGKEVSKFKDGEDDYPIQLRLADKYRYDVSSLYDKRLTFRDNKGKFHQIPVSSIADLEYSSTFGSVKRKDLDRMIEVSSNVLEGYNANEIVQQIQALLENHKMPEGYSFKFTGEQEEQQKNQEFLMSALIIAVSAIFLILVSQFNSGIKPFIIVGSVIFSLIGVFLGMALFGDDFVIIMTGVGIISLAGVVVNNAIVLIDYVDLTRNRKRQELGMSEDEHLPSSLFIECLVEGGYTRLRPVLLTAITTVLGLVPLATGLNIDFFGLFAHFKPNIYMGGPNADTWGPMAWTVIYGLVFATFLTLVIVPVMYYISDLIVQMFAKKAKPTEEQEVTEPQTLNDQEALETNHQ